MNHLLKILMNTAYHELGIAPIEYTIHDYNKLLKDLPPDEARSLKRKFRKVWRSLVKQSDPRLVETFSRQLGLGATSPTKQQKNSRKREVHRRVMLAHVLPTLKKIKDGDPM